jgi:hypothetical protein
MKLYIFIINLYPPSPPPPPQTYKTYRILFLVLWVFLWGGGGWVGSRPAIEEQCSSGVLSITLANISARDQFRGAGGGEVSGGGTLYMKWGAGRFGLRREC